MDGTRVVSALLAVVVAVVTATVVAQVPANGAARPVVYLTFDDGPNATYTPRVLDLLDRYDAKATFFVVGKEIDATSAVFDRVVRSGHGIGNHTWAHEHLPTLTNAQIDVTIAATTRAAAAHGYQLRCFRPPYGDVTARVRDEIAAQGYSMQLWDIDTRDWAGMSAAAIARSAEGASTGGRVVLMHDGGGPRAATVAALATVLADLSGRVEFRALPNCLPTGTDPPASVSGGSSRTAVSAIDAAPLGDPLGFTAMAPVRVLDTRDMASPLAASEVRRVVVPPSLAVGAGALAVNLTVTEASQSGYATAWNCDGSVPLASNVNFTRGATRAASTVVPLAPDGSFCVFASGRTHLVVDIQGSYRPDATVGYSTVAPRRLYDSRDRGRMLAAGEMVVVATPPGARAVALNLTATDAPGPGFVTAVPCGDNGSIARVSDLNYRGNETAANMAQVASSSAGVCVSASSATHLVIDLQGIYVEGGDRFQPARPFRLLDTRDGTGGWVGLTAPHQVLDLELGGVRHMDPRASSLLATVTAADERTTGFVSVWPCSLPQPVVSTLNFGPNDVVANSAMLPGGFDKACMSPSSRSDLVVDVVGWYIAA